MIQRRDMLIGSACVAAAGAAYVLKPRRSVALIGDESLEDVVPRDFADWSSEDVSDLVAPKVEGSLASKLYNQTVGRIYRQGPNEIMMLLAYGKSNNDELQLHRPESCYPAFGFALSMSRPTDLKLRTGVTIPARRLVADAPGRRENIVYWSRLGEYLPVDAGEQRRDRLRAAMSGYVADGLLARFSAVGAEPGPALAMVEQFIVDLVNATPGPRRAALIGTTRARALA
jgi:EpsI family protein